MKAIWYEAAIYVSRDETYVLDIYLWNRATLMIFCWSILSIAIPYTFVSGTRFFRIIVTIIGTAACWSWSTFTCIAVLWEKKNSKKCYSVKTGANMKCYSLKTKLFQDCSYLCISGIVMYWRPFSVKKNWKKNYDEIMKNKIKI